MTPPPPAAPVWSVRCHGVRTKRPGARSASGAPAGRSSSTASNAAQMSSRSVSNQARARALRASSVAGRGGAWPLGQNLIHREPFVCLIASPSAMAAAIATLIERKPGRIGTSSRASAAAMHRLRHRFRRQRDPAFRSGDREVRKLPAQQARRRGAPDARPAGRGVGRGVRHRPAGGGAVLIVLRATRARRSR